MRRALPTLADKVGRKSKDCTAVAGIPDMRFINRSVPIAEIAAALDLRSGQSGNLHCWHPERHQHGDRTASVGIRQTHPRFGFRWGYYQEQPAALG